MSTDNKLNWKLNWKLPSGTSSVSHQKKQTLKLLCERTSRKWRSKIDESEPDNLQCCQRDACLDFVTNVTWIISFSLVIMKCVMERSRRVAECFVSERRRTTRPNNWLCWENVSVNVFVLLWLTSFANAFCPNGCECNDLTLSVTCNNGSLQNIPILLNPGVRNLHFVRNKIKDVSQSLVFYGDLEMLDLTNNEIGTLGEKSFEMQRNLRELHLRYNKLVGLGAFTFQGLDSLSILSLDHNSIGHIDDSSFNRLRSLQELNLSRNRLKGLSDKIFSDLESLRVLKLNGNRLTDVPSGSFGNLSQLQELYLIDNQISSVVGKAFHGMPYLSHLYLAKNNISHLSATAFHGLSELEILSLEDNRLAALPADALSLVTSIQVLDLSGNLFEAIEPYALQGLSSMIIFKVSRCPRLTSISSTALTGALKLEKLILSHNPLLTSLPPTALTSLHNLRLLDLTACGLFHLMPNQIPFKNLAVLRLSGNPLHCNCSMVWLSRLVNDRNNSPVVDEPTCSSPPSLYGLPVQEISASVVDCDMHMGIVTLLTCVSVIILALLLILIILCWRWRRKEESNSSTCKIGHPWNGAWQEDNYVTHPRHGRTPPSLPASSPPGLGPFSPLAPHLPPDHPLNTFHLHRHDECHPHCLYTAYHPLLLPESANASPTDECHWYATINASPHKNYHDKNYHDKSYHDKNYHDKNCHDKNYHDKNYHDSPTRHPSHTATMVTQHSFTDSPSPRRIPVTYV